MSWTDERVALLGKLWKEGKTAKEIAQALGEGVTRNAVIGKAHRLNLSGRSSPIQKDKPPKAKNNTKAVSKTTSTSTGTHSETQQKNKSPFPQPANKNTNPSAKKLHSKTDNVKDISEQKSKSDRITMHDLKGSMCRWPFGDPQEKDFHFCGDRKMPGFPYCEEHAKAAYQTKKKAKILNPEALETQNSKNEDQEDQEQMA